MPRHRVTAVIWDFDGTLADTLDRNLQITRQIVRRLLGDAGENSPALSSREAYGRAVHAAPSWRELYVREFGVPIERTPEAAPLWTALHREDRDVPPLFDGVAEAVRSLACRRQGIVSQNGRDNIEHALGPPGLLECFTAIVADEDLPFHRQKPEPDGLLRCAADLHDDVDLTPTDTVLYVGDHPVDVECVRRATSAPAADGCPFRLLSVGVEYGLAWRRSWPKMPDYVAARPTDVLAIVDAIEG
jgi:N-acetyl-D-muramate 6-phosphate phosphatase